MHLKSIRCCQGIGVSSRIASTLFDHNRRSNFNAKRLQSCTPTNDGDASLVNMIWAIVASVQKIRKNLGIHEMGWPCSVITNKSDTSHARSIRSSTCVYFFFFFSMFCFVNTEWKLCSSFAAWRCNLMQTRCFDTHRTSDTKHTQGITHAYLNKKKLPLYVRHGLRAMASIESSLK